MADDESPSSTGSYPLPWRRVRVPLAVVTGVLMVLAFPRLGDRYGLDHLIWITFLPLFLAARGVGARKGFLLGWFAGMTLELGGFFWILHSIRTFGKLGVVVSSLLFLAWLVWETLPWAILGLALGRCRRRMQILWVLPLWVGIEHWFPRVWPWHTGGALYAQTWLLQCVDLVGTSGLTALVFLTAASLYLLATRRAGEKGPVVTAFVTVALVGAALVYGALRVDQARGAHASRPELRVGLVQGYLASDARSSSGTETYIGETRQLLAENAEPLDLIVWPEGADDGRRHPFDLTPEASPWAFHRVLQPGTRRLATPPRYLIRDEFDVPLLFGAAGFVHGPPDAQGRLPILENYNVAAYLHPGREVEFYRKNKPVPFGESVPGLDLLPASWRAKVPNIGNLDLGTDNPVMQLGEHRFKNLVCYEAVIPSYVREAAEGADFLVNITEDYWYGDTAHVSQHRSVFILRAVENRVPVVRVTNVGPSGIVDVTGAFHSTEATFERVRTVEVLRPGRLQSLYTRLGHFFPLICLLIGIAFQVGLWRASRASTGIPKSLS